MNRKTLNLFLLFCLSISSLAEQPETPKIIPVKDSNNILFAFGSLHPTKDTENPQILNYVANLNPDVWAWLGGAVYFNIKFIAKGYGMDPLNQIQQIFTTALNIPAYKYLRNTTTVIGTWDSYDYGQNKGGKRFQHKDIMQQVFLDFLEEPMNSTRRQRKGVYESYYLGNTTQVKVIMLDARYSRDERSLFSSNGTDILGEEQWKWLENELNENQAEYLVIGSGSQVLPDDRIVPDSWYAESREKLIGLIRKYKVGGVVILSGDANYAEIMRYPCKERVGFELYEFTSSGLLHSKAAKMPFAYMLPSIVYPTTWNKKEDKYFGENFGVLNFVEGEKKGVVFEVRDAFGSVVLERFIEYSELVFNESVMNSESSCIADVDKYTRFLNHFKESLLGGEKVMWIIIFGLFGALVGIILILILWVMIMIWIYKYITGLVCKKKVKEEKPKTE